MDANHPGIQKAYTLACHPARPCKQIRSCAYCAGKRQQKAADLADRLAAALGQLFLTTITPHDPDAAAVARVRERWLRLTAPQAGIWSIERGPTAQRLHIHALHPASDSVEIRKADVHTTPLTASPRIAAAYITKRESIPPASIYSGKTFGTFGTARDLILRNTESPAVAAAGLDLAILPAGERSPVYGWLRVDSEPPPVTREDYRAIAARHLPGLHALCAAIRPPARRRAILTDDKTSTEREAQLA